MKRILCAVLALLMCLCALPALAVNGGPTYCATLSNREIMIYNFSGYSISEVYIYPSYNSRWGDPRNSAWIYNGSSGKVSVTNNETYLNCTWNLRIGLSLSRYRISYVEFEDFALSEYLGGSMQVTMVDDDIIQIAPYGTDNTSGNYGGSGGSYTASSYNITFSNYTGRSVTEIYVYPSYNSKWGDCRNSKWIRSGNSGTIRIKGTEANLNCQWNITIGFDGGRYVSYVTWEDVDLWSYLDHTVSITMSGDDCYSLDCMY